MINAITISHVHITTALSLSVKKILHLNLSGIMFFILDFSFNAFLFDIKELNVINIRSIKKKLFLIIMLVLGVAVR